jgi:hypothetical protein
MPTTITAQAASPNGTTLTFAAADATGNAVKNNGAVYVYLVNDGASPVGVTFAQHRACNQGFTHDATGSVPADGKPYPFGPFGVDRFNDANSLLTWTYDDDPADITVAATKPPTT